jgi:uncharacterized membrane protein (UPF0136 family)
MAKTAIAFGILLTLLGLTAYFGISSESITALIPAFFGVPVIILGWLALNEQYRKHSMHIAAALMLLGFIGTGMRVFPQLFCEIAKSIRLYCSANYVTVMFDGSSRDRVGEF